MREWVQHIGSDRYWAERVKQHLLLVPEAPVLFILLMIAWGYNFPPVVGGLAALVVVLFVVRLFCLASAVQELGLARYEQADRLAQTALRLHPWSPDALTLRGNTQLLQGNDEAAEALLRDAVRWAPEHAANHAALATVLLARGDYAAGREHATRALRLDSASPYAVQQLAWLALHREHDPRKTRRIVDTIELSAHPPAVGTSLLVLRGEAQIMEGDLEEARATICALEAALPHCPRPQQAELCFHVGRLQTLLGDDGGAYFRRSVRLDPRGRWAHAAWRAAVNPAECGSRVAS
jgi:tetratricopeptide (TPR) repeat protein